MADQYRLSHIECVQERRKARRRSDPYRGLPGVGVEGPAVTEDDGLARALALVEDRRSIRYGDGTCTHGIISSIMFENVLLFRFFGTSVKVQKKGLLPLEKSAIKLEKVPESALNLENGLLDSCRAKTQQ
jgi:hypothetical protein